VLQVANLGKNGGNAWNNEGMADGPDGDMPDDFAEMSLGDAATGSVGNSGDRSRRHVWLGGFSVMPVHFRPSEPPHTFPSPRLALMIASRRNALALSHGELAERAKVFRPTVEIGEAECSVLENPKAEKPSLNGVVVPVARALGYSRREITLTWRIDQVESRLKAISSALLEQPNPAFRMCTIPSEPQGMISRMARSRIEGAMPFDVEIPESLRGSFDLRAHIEWAVAQCVNRKMFGWLRWSSLLVLCISSEGVVTHEFAVVTRE